MSKQDLGQVPLGNPTGDRRPSPRRQIRAAEAWLADHPDASTVSEELDELYAELNSAR